jgi:hypothetical protein
MNFGKPVGVDDSPATGNAGNSKKRSDVREQRHDHDDGGGADPKRQRSQRGGTKSKGRHCRQPEWIYPATDSRRRRRRDRRAFCRRRLFCGNPETRQFDFYIYLSYVVPWKPPVRRKALGASCGWPSSCVALPVLYILIPVLLPCTNYNVFPLCNSVVEATMVHLIFIEEFFTVSLFIERGFCP